jgi:plasmid stability protein
MATLYVENVPDDLYEALRERARRNRRSIAAEALTIIEQNVPTAAELARRKKALDWALKMMKSKPPGKGPFPSAEELVREAREERDRRADEILGEPPEDRER